MRMFVVAVSLGLMTAVVIPPSARAEGASCAAVVGDKKLAGAAKASFMKKCEADARTSCDTAAADKKLAGAAKASFTKKCVADAVS